MTGPRQRPFQQPWKTITVDYPQAGLSTPAQAMIKRIGPGGIVMDQWPGGTGIYRVPAKPVRPWKLPEPFADPAQRRRVAEAAIRASQRKAMDEAAGRARQARDRVRPVLGSQVGIDVRLRDHLRNGGTSRFPYAGPSTLGIRPPTTHFGRQMLQFVGLQKQWQAKQTPLFDSRKLGSCVETTLLRMHCAYKSAYGKDLLAGATPQQREVYDAIAGTRTGRAAWAKVPRSYRYKGAPGALAYMGLADIVEAKQLWQGKADLGAPVQIWYANRGGPGHSAILERYIRNDKGEVEGIIVSDQWLNYRLIRKPLGFDASSYISARFRKRD
jgi:hypothetical protein